MEGLDRREVCVEACGMWMALKGESVPLGGIHLSLVKRAGEGAHVQLRSSCRAARLLRRPQTVLLKYSVMYFLWPLFKNGDKTSQESLHTSPVWLSAILLKSEDFVILGPHCEGRQILWCR